MFMFFFSFSFLCFLKAASGTSLPGPLLVRPFSTKSTELTDVNKLELEIVELKGDVKKLEAVIDELRSEVKQAEQDAAVIKKENPTGYKSDPEWLALQDKIKDTRSQITLKEQQLASLQSRLASCKEQEVKELQATKDRGT